jgi:4-hydroxybenzoate polyprenyltransferase
MKIPASVQLLRPHQWIKNGFVLAPIVFSRELFLTDAVGSALRAFGAFCMAASAVYVINDIVDVEADRAHPVKRKRPLAAGTISKPQAYLVFGLVITFAILLSFPLHPYFQLSVAAYFLLNMAYSLKLKEVVLLDIFVIATGFMLRVLGGAYAIQVQVSNWIILCTMFISLFLGFAKRRGEILLLQRSGQNSERKVLSSYTVTFIDQMITISATATVISYALYTVAPRTVDMFGTERLIYTTGLVIFGIFRYLYLIHMKDSTENPASAVLSDKPILLVTLVWLVTCVLIIYGSGLR